ncbi:MAG: cation:proton antiporter [Acidobacteria bacterium]|jgi:multicomponent Na+:H+ antiporter subunit F|nr:cation:proton antiporter [Acidobacteriota bacterium]
MEAKGTPTVFTEILSGILVVAVVLAFIRLARGPSLPDRAVALDLVATIVIGLIGVYAVMTREARFLDLAVVLALIAFLGTVAFARFIAKGGLPWDRS